MTMFNDVEFEKYVYHRGVWDQRMDHIELLFENNYGVELIYIRVGEWYVNELRWTNWTGEIVVCANSWPVIVRDDDLHTELHKIKNKPRWFNP